MRSRRSSRPSWSSRARTLVAAASVRATSLAGACVGAAVMSRDSVLVMGLLTATTCRAYNRSCRPAIPMVVTAPTRRALSTPLGPPEGFGARTTLAAVRFPRRGSASADTGAGTALDADDIEEPSEDTSTATTAASKGRPTPKRRDAEGRRGPVRAPQTRKEAMARQRQLAKEQKSQRARTGTKPMSMAEQRAAIRRGDESALPRRDRGPTRRLARNYVDSRRMFSNYLLWLFPLMIAASFVKELQGVQLVVIALFLALVVEWYIVGRRVRALAVQRFGSAEGSAMSIGFYAGSRAYLP